MTFDNLDIAKIMSSRIFEYLTYLKDVNRLSLMGKAHSQGGLINKFC